MQLLFHLFVLSRILSLSFANDYFIHRHLLSRQSLDCLPAFLEYPSEPDVQCGGESSYVMPGCACCPGGTLGCFTATDVCSADAFGNPICCPEDEPDCSEEKGSAATTAPPSPTTAYDNPGLAVTSTQPDPVSTPASSPKAPPSSSTTASDNSGPPAARVSSGASTSRLVELESLVMIILLGLI
ncbi:hypothetical protein JMJ35_009405 [Cladonia borealis]|uniref:GPI anchored protein n=1 Tax=Cladonia borealis TaxID=184061 RepID=A0AA39QTW4_9LECA|nr:hypothetical protein JMJ35_009405 [Cladonia borealis]